jgi:hypothetical protein
MANTFDLKKFLTENSLTLNSKLIKEAYQPKSKLEQIIQAAWEEKDLSKAKQIVIDLIEPSKIKSKDQILSTIKTISSKPRLDQYLANSLLKFEKLGLSENTQLLKEARVDGFDENQKAFEVTFINKYGGGDFRILNAETPEQAEEVFTDIFIDNPNFVQSIKSIKPYQVPAPKPKAEPQPGLEGVDYNSIKIDGIEPDDYPDFVDAYVLSAEFEDGTPLSEEELQQLTDELYQSGELADMAAQSLYEGKKKPVMETKLTARERKLVSIVENALGTQVDDREEEDFINPGNTAAQARNRKDYLNTFGAPPYKVSEGEEVPMAEDDMVQEKSLPKYENIEKLMQEIEAGTNEAAHSYKMKRMKEIAEMLEAKVGSLEEGEGADFVDAKKVKQMKKDIMTLRKQAEKLEKEYDKKFTKKEGKKEEK